MSYSQGDEERWILKHTPQEGRFLDIGAWQAKQFSNTRALYERGWSGVMVEPSPMPMHGLLQEYGNDPRIVLIQAAVGLDNNFVRLAVTQDAVSTTEPRWERRWKEEGGFYGSMYVLTITLNDVFLKFGGGFDFVNIDTEGTSVECLKAMLAIGVHPQCICFEHDRRFAESFAHFDAIGYKLVHENDTNRVVALR